MSVPPTAVPIPFCPVTLASILEVRPASHSVKRRLIERPSPYSSASVPLIVPCEYTLRKASMAGW
jgi:hypothetical protein